MSLLDAASSAAARLRDATPEHPVELIARPSGDAVAATAILARALMRRGLSFHARFHREADLFVEADLDSSAHDSWIFLDVGTSLLPRLQKFPGRTLLIDVDAAHAAAGVARLNPLRHGERENTAGVASTALALAVAMDATNWDLAPLALVGARARRRDPAPFDGFEARIADEARQRRLLRTRTALALEDLPLLELLTLPDPRLPFLGTRERATEFLERHRLPAQASPHELGPRDAQTLASALTVNHLGTDRAAADAARLFLPLDESPLHEMPLVRMASLVSCAAQADESGLALAWLLGDPSVQNELESIENRVRGRLSQELNRLPPSTFGGLRIHRADAVGDVDELARIIVARFPDATATTVVHADAAERTHAVVAGPDRAGFALWVHECANQEGGHASGQDGIVRAFFPARRLDAFLARLSTTIRKQVPA